MESRDTRATALTSWATASASARFPLPVFAEVIDQDQDPEGDEKICSDDPCHCQGIQLLAVCAHCQERGKSSEMGALPLRQGKRRSCSTAECQQGRSGSGWKGERSKQKGPAQAALSTPPCLSANRRRPGAGVCTFLRCPLLFAWPEPEGAKHLLGHCSHPVLDSDY